MELSKIEEYLEDLKELRVAIKEKHNLSREIFSPRAFRFYGLISAVFILNSFFCIRCYCISNR